MALTPEDVEALKTVIVAAFERKIDEVDGNIVSPGSQLAELRAGAIQRFEANDRRFDGMDRRFDAVDRRFDALDRRFDALDVRVFDRDDGLACAADYEYNRRRHDELTERAES